MRKPVRVPLKWTGGKSWLAPFLRTLENNFSPTWKVPFCGGCSDLILAGLTNVHANDDNPELMRFWTWLQRGLHHSDQVPFDHPDDDTEAKKKLRYYVYRNQFNQNRGTTDRTSMQQALLFLYLNRHGYRGMYRVSKRSGFNVPYGGYKKPVYPNNAELQVIGNAARHWKFCRKDFRQFMDQFVVNASGGLLYCDPPYLPVKKTDFTGYTTGGFSLEDHEALHAYLLDHREGVILCNSASQATLDMYGGNNSPFTIWNPNRSHRIGNGRTSTPKGQVIVTKNIPEDLIPWKRVDESSLV